MRYFLNTGAFQKRRKSGNQSPDLSSLVIKQILSRIDLSFYLLTSCNTDIRISCEKQRNESVILLNRYVEKDVEETKGR